MIKDLNEEIKEINKQKEMLQTEVDVFKEERHLDFLSKNYNHRITWFKNKETGVLLFAVSYHVDNRAVQERAAIKLAKRFVSSVRFIFS